MPGSEDCVDVTLVGEYRWLESGVFVVTGVLVTYSVGGARAPQSPDLTQDKHELNLRKSLLWKSPMPLYDVHRPSELQGPHFGN